MQRTGTTTFDGGCWPLGRARHGYRGSLFQEIQGLLLLAYDVYLPCPLSFTSLRTKFSKDFPQGVLGTGGQAPCLLHFFLLYSVLTGVSNTHSSPIKSGLPKPLYHVGEECNRSWKRRKSHFVWLVPSLLC